MDYFQGVVTEYLRANRATFVNTECLIQLDQYLPTKGRHWYCDAVAVNFVEQRVYLCEVSYAATLGALIRRLINWSNHWPAICMAISRDCGIPSSWAIHPWVFIPEKRRSLFETKIAILAKNLGAGAMPVPIATSLENIVPWEYPSWNRKLEEIAEEGAEANGGEGEDSLSITSAT